MTSSPTSTEAAPEAPRWFDRRTLRARLAIGFAALIALTLAVGAVALVSHRFALDAVDTFLDRDKRIAELCLASNAAMFKARRAEKDFLLKVREFGYEEARSRYLTLLQIQLAAVRDNLAALRAVAVDADVVAETRAIEDAIARYESGFLRVVELHGELGRRDSGLEGQFRRRAHAIEALLAHGAPERLRSGLLSLRRWEKDFLRRGLSRDAEAFLRDSARFRKELAQAPLAAAPKAELLRLVDEYRGLFGRYVAADAEIETASAGYLRVVQGVEPALDSLRVRADRAAAETRERLGGLGRATAAAVLAAVLAAIALGATVAVFIVRSVDRALRDCVAFAGRLAGGDLAARLRPAEGSEFGVVVAALNHMAEALQTARGAEAVRSEELRRSNRTLRLLSQCNETLVRATDEAELLAAVCRQIVDIGGYRLAWVGFARHDAARSIEPVAHAGSDRDYIDALGLSWGDDAARHGVGGVAIRDGRPAVARFIASDPAFAFWRDDALARGLASCAALPLRSRQGTLGTLSIYSGDEDAFDAAEIGLLQELADDLAYGVASLREAAARARAERELDYRTNFDVLTGLPNRNLFCDRLQQAVAQAQRDGRLVAVLLVGLDRFKAVNDSLGQAAGDAVLRAVGERLAGALRETDSIARLAGDEFAVAIGGLAQPEEVLPLARKLLAAVLSPLMVDGRELSLGASLGIGLHPRDGDEVEALLTNAGAALGDAKLQGGGEFRFYAPEMNERAARRLALEADLRRAIERDELLLHFQPKMSLINGDLVGAEALLRWQHPARGTVSPAEFIPLAEDTGLIQPLGEWVIEAVCRQLRAWLDAGLRPPTVAANLSARQFRVEHLVDQVAQALRANRLDPALLELEVTEGALMHDVEAAVATLHRLKSVGVKLALDDFGTGYSSLAYLKRLPIDRLKIDQSFVRDIASDPDDAAICVAVIGLAHNLKLAVTAEGVENDGQLGYLRRHRCDEMQGYHFSRPLPADDFAQLLRSGRRLDLPALADGRQTLLLVDDEENILKSLVRLLRRDGYEIICAGSAREGLELLARNEVQVILADQRMPEMNGTEFLSRVRDLHPDTVRIVLSGYTDLETVTEAVNRGAIYKFLTKPWGDDILREEVRAAFRQFDVEGRRVGAVQRLNPPIQTA
ncbi:EAL domain-containing protein [Azospira restricta]|uniref:EAL domain-containing protein n=1 Tax=Azospira restricta TaxID=404405 RepID=A0A974SS07_9RHOO|nr:EAL domain-containing protein [Azospira restricta]QRJ65411.1 EAL domain-containing protein [Azospira restricta]